MNAPEPVEVYRSPWRPACDERAFVLHAVGIASEVVASGPTWCVRVAAEDALPAMSQLVRYAQENPPRRRFLQPAGSQPGAWLAAAAYAVMLLAVGWLAGRKARAIDWLQAGLLDPTAVRAGDWWRAVTAQTLHFDVAHLLANLGFGAFFIWLAGQLLGPGVAFAGVVAMAACANLLDAAIQPADHLSAGASTAVFATLGLLSAYSWRRRADSGERWAYRWAPLVAGVFLLAFLGTGDERTDVLAHLSGFVAGAGLGVLLALRRHPFGPVTQWSAGLVAAALVIAAWRLALG